jgi:hypothetical protein
MTSLEEFEQWIITQEGKALKSLGLQPETIEVVLRDTWLKKDGHGRFVPQRTQERWNDWQACRARLTITLPSHDEVLNMGGREVRSIILAELRAKGLKVAT